jgi:hypothetical protein
MSMKYFFRLLCILFLACVVIYGCGSSEGGGDSDTTAEEAAAEEAAVAEETIVVTMALTSTVAEGSQLSAGGTAEITVTLTDQDGEAYTESADVAFSSECANAGLATIEDSVTTVNGTGTVDYEADGCTGEDTIVATATAEGESLSATLDIDVAQGDVGSIAFVSADPETIALKGTGGAGRSESSTVIFEVRDENGNSLQDETVNFGLTTDIGGLSLTENSADSDSSGQVRTNVVSGSVPTSVRVSATVESTSITTVSDSLVVSTGLPDQNSFSISSEITNPEAGIYDGEEVEVSIRAADHFNNPAPDGTAVYFTTEGGAIESYCILVDGVCTVTWTSQEPRPADGRVTVLATAIGEESFSDLNGNGFYDATDLFTIATDDLAEAWLDIDEDDIYDVATEEFFDFNSNSIHDAGDGIYSGSLCSEDAAATGDCTEDLVHVRGSFTMCLSGSFATVTFSEASPIDVGAASVTLYITVEDDKGNGMPADSTIEVETSNGEIVGETSYTIGSGCSPYTFAIGLQKDATPGDTGLLSVTVTTPKNNITIATISVDD